MPCLARRINHIRISAFNCCWSLSFSWNPAVRHSSTCLIMDLIVPRSDMNCDVMDARKGTSGTKSE